MQILRYAQDNLFLTTLMKHKNLPASQSSLLRENCLTGRFFLALLLGRGSSWS
jgi:hypothetical protein